MPAPTTVWEVRPHPYSEKHLLLVVTVNGKVYACAAAWEKSDNILEEQSNCKPTSATVMYEWKHNRHQFLPYNESTGSFVQRGENK